MNIIKELENLIQNCQEKKIIEILNKTINEINNLYLYDEKENIDIEKSYYNMIKKFLVKN